MQAYCVKCRSKKEMKNPKAITMKNGKPATQGVCPICGTKMFRIGYKYTPESKTQTKQQPYPSQLHTDRERAFHNLLVHVQTAREEGNLNLAINQLLNLQPSFDYLRNDPSGETLLNELDSLRNLPDTPLKQERFDRLFDNIREVIKDPQLVSQKTDKEPFELPLEISDALVAPTPKVVSDRWVIRDALGYEAYARSIAMLITHEETVPPLTIGIKAPWGAGKTSVMKMVQHILDGDAVITEGNRNKDSVHQIGASISLNDLVRGLKEDTRLIHLTPKDSEKGKTFGIPSRITVWFNAWKYQNSEQIWAGLAHCIISQITARMLPEERERFWLKLQASRTNTDRISHQIRKLVLRAFLPKALAYSTGLTVFLAISISWLGFANLVSQLGAFGITGAGVLNWLLERRNKLREKVSGDFQDLVREPTYEGKEGFLHLVESDMRQVLDLVATPESPLVIFVDDLDRCAPHRVAEIVEAVNLFLSGDYPNCIFVMGLEPAVVAAALEIENKDLLERTKEYALADDQVPWGWRFMEKIIQLPLTLPPPTNSGIRTYINDLIGRPEEDLSSDYIETAEVVPEEHIIKKYAAHLGKAKTAAQVVSETHSLLNASNVEDKAAIIEASKRAYSNRFRTEDPEVVKFIEFAITYLDANPRQIKRYVNLLRFYCTLRHAITLDRLLDEGTTPEMPSDAALAKFVLMCIKWPQITMCLELTSTTEQLDLTDKASLLTFLEHSARSLEYIDDAKAAEEWKSLLERQGLNSVEWLASRSFRKFLASGEQLAHHQGCCLW